MLEFKRLKDGRIVNKEYQYIVIHTIGKEYEVTIGCESLFISNSLDNVFSFVLQYIQRVEKLLSKGSG